MRAPPIPDDEEKRLALLEACNIIYTPAEEAFDDIARVAAEICGAEIALITLVDSDYQWFKARVGVELEGIARDLSFCGHCINHQHPFVVEDTHLDARFSDNPLVTGEPKLRFYAGVPLLVEEGSAIGAISVADRAPRTMTPRQVESLQRLAQQIAHELRARRTDRPSATRDACPIAAGSVIGQTWTIVREIGRGGTGVVFEAVHASGQRVAIKVLLPQWLRIKEVVERFAREARVLMHLRTPFVAKLLEVGNLDASDGALPFLVLEYLEGKDFSALVSETAPLATRDALRWCADACDGLAEAHAAGIIHRDLKPSNLFLAESGGAEVTKVLDFGIAAGDPMAGASALTLAHTMIGTPCYMSPEQMLSSHDVDARSDIWSMGTVLYELLTGVRAFDGNGFLEICSRVMAHTPAPLRERVGTISSEVEGVVLKCLRRKPEERFASMPALASALRASAV